MRLGHYYLKVCRNVILDKIQTNLAKQKLEGLDGPGQCFSTNGQAMKGKQENSEALNMSF